MSWTLEEVLDAYDQELKILREKEDLLEDKVEAQRRRERDVVINTAYSCTRNNIKAYVVGPEAIDEAVRDGYDDPGILEALRCISTYITQSSQLDAKRYIPTLRKIGSESVYGYAWLTNTGYNGDTFVVKTPRKARYNDQQLHEFFVGVYGTNKLRDRIPNFVYVMGTFGCNPPIVQDDKGLAHCRGATPVQYILYENVRDSESLTDFVRKCTYEQYLNVLVQLALALQLAYEDLNFTHYDLHTGNVLVRDMGQDMYIAYNVHGTRKYLKTRYVATIIDLGMSHIVYNGEHYGYFLPKTLCTPIYANPIADVHRVLLYTLLLAAGDLGNARYDRELRPRNPGVYNRGKDLVRYFYSDAANVVRHLRALRDKYYVFPLSEAEPIDFFDFLYAREKHTVDRFLFDEKPPRFFGCRYRNDCSTLQQVVERYATPDPWRKDAYALYRKLREGTYPEVEEEARRNISKYVDQLIDETKDDAETLLSYAYSSDPWPTKAEALDVWTNINNALVVYNYIVDRLGVELDERMRNLAKLRYDAR